LEFDEQHEALIIRYENQGCERWGICAADLERDDPPVFQFSERVQCSPTVTAFALFVMAYEAQFADGVLWLGGQEVPRGLITREVRRRLISCKLPSTYWLMTPIKFYEATDLMLNTHRDYWVYVAARNEKALEQLSEPLRRRLERHK
jgi:hypothetical protein